MNHNTKYKHMKREAIKSSNGGGLSHVVDILPRGIISLSSLTSVLPM